MMKQWMGTARYVYNRALHACKTEEDTHYNAIALKKRFVTRKYNNGIINTNVEDWELETPKDVRDGALRDLQKAFSTNLKDYKCKGKRFRMRYKKKKTFSAIVIPKTAIEVVDGKLSIYPTYTKHGIRVSKDKFFKTIRFDHDCRLQYKHGEWYLVVPITVQCIKETSEKNGICSLDPGVHTFQTLYSEVETVKLQQNTELLKILHSKLDAFQSLRARKLISSNHYTRRIRRLNKRIDHLIDELHFKTINYLTSRYNWILLPIFESQEMAMKGFNRKCNRNMIQLRHFKFKERLIAKCELNRTTDITVVTEEYTSKTCTRCGAIKENLNGNRIFNCDSCGLRCDRDVNGARNILLKHFVGI